MAVLGVGFLFLASQSALSEPDIGPRIDALVADTMQRAHVPGMSVLVAKGDVVLYEKGYGLSDVEQSTPVNSDAVFAIGSVTKQFTGLAIAQLVAAGKVALDDPIRKYIPDLPASYDNIKIKNLLNHTSGIYNYTRNSKLHELAAKKHSHKEMMAWFINEKLAFRSGEKWSYTNSGTYLLGMAIEKISGMSYADYVQKNVFEPFGMRHSYYGDSGTIIPKRARGYDISDGVLINAQSYDASIPYSAGALLSTPEDLFKYVRSVHDGGLVPDKVRQVIYTTDPLSDGEKIRYALGCFGISKFQDHRKYSHAGEIYGYFSQLAYYPDDKLTIVILSNRKSYFPTPISLEHKIARLVLDLPAPKVEKKALEDKYIKVIDGTYDLGNVLYFSDDRVTLWRAGDYLLMAFGGIKDEAHAIPFYYAGNGRFVSAIDDELVLNFSLSGSKTKGTIDAFDSVFAFEKTNDKK
jgi:CubicO group peptidase (beta-lactamase class C family)